MGGNSKISVREQRDVCLPHLLQQAAAPNPRSPAAVYTGNLRGTAGEMPKQCLFLGSSNPCWKSSNDSIHSYRSQYTSAQTEGRCDSVTPALYFKAKVKFVASAVAGNGSAFISHLSAQPTTCSLFDLQLWSPSKKASKCRWGNNFNRLNTSRTGSMEYFQVDTIRTKLTGRSSVLLRKDRKLLILILSTKAKYSILQKALSLDRLSLQLTKNWYVLKKITNHICL